MSEALTALLRGAVVPFLPLLHDEGDGVHRVVAMRNLRLVDVTLQDEAGKRVTVPLVGLSPLLRSKCAPQFSQAWAKAAYVETPRVILEVVSETVEIPISELQGVRQGQQVARARQLAYRVLRDRTGMSLTDIGILLSRDHSTVSYGIKRTETRPELFEPTHSVVVGLLDARAHYAAKEGSAEED